MIRDGGLLHIRGKVVAQKRVQALVQSVGDLHGVGAGLFAHPHQNRGNPVGARVGLLFFPIVSHVSDVRQKDGVPLYICYHHFFHIIHGRELSYGTEGNGIDAVPDLAAGAVSVRIVDFFDHRRHRDAVTR